MKGSNDQRKEDCVYLHLSDQMVGVASNTLGLVVTFIYFVLIPLRQLQIFLFKKTMAMTQFFKPRSFQTKLFSRLIDFVLQATNQEWGECRERPGIEKRFSPIFIQSAVMSGAQVMKGLLQVPFLFEKRSEIVLVSTRQKSRE